VQIRVLDAIVERTGGCWKFCTEESRSLCSLRSSIQYEQEKLENGGMDALYIMHDGCEECLQKFWSADLKR
jgi:hypothetical protein